MTMKIPATMYAITYHSSRPVQSAEQSDLELQVTKKVLEDTGNIYEDVL